MDPILDQLKKALEGKLVQGHYGTVVGGAKPSTNTVFREGVDRDEFKGGVERVFRSKAGNLLITVRNVNRITAGVRMAVTDEQLEAAALDPRIYKGLPGEFQFRSLRVEGIKSLSVCSGGRWKPYATPGLASFDALVAALTAGAAHEPTWCAVDAPPERGEGFLDVPSGVRG